MRKKYLYQKTYFIEIAQKNFYSSGITHKNPNVFFTESMTQLALRFALYDSTGQVISTQLSNFSDDK